MTNEMLDRVEDAISEGCNHALPPFLLARCARAALQAMREPTEAMCEAAEWHQQSDVNRYQAAIDEALK